MTRARLGLWLVAMLVAGTVTAAEEAPPSWQRLYVDGIRLEAEGRWREAMDRFERAASLRPDPESGVRLGSIDYDPYVHIARCALEVDAPASVVRRVLERSARGGVTPGSSGVTSRDRPPSASGWVGRFPTGCGT